jgi:2-oxoacid:acceptor oxidoreductase gamma subunit (pyruvate/2-ketoisovalerate family)
MASQMLGLAYFKAGYYPQCYSVFGGERRGAPVFSYLRVDQKKILLKCNIKIPNQLICFDESIFDPTQPGALPLPGGKVLINTRRSLDGLEHLDQYTVAGLDAGGISLKAGLGRVINTTILGACCKLNQDTNLDDVLEAVRETVPAKVEANLEAVKLAYDAVQIRQPRG